MKLSEKVKFELPFANATRPSNLKSKRTKIRKYNLKKNEKWGFRNFVYAGNYGMIYDFYIYTGKENNEFVGLQKFSAVVARLS